MVQALRSVQWASANKSSLATIFANPIYRGVKVFNREPRVEGEHGRKRRRNPQQDVVTSEVEAIVPEQLWSRVQEMLTGRRANRLPVRRYAGGYAQSGSGFLWHPRAQLLSGAHSPHLGAPDYVSGDLGLKRPGRNRWCTIRHAPTARDRITRPLGLVSGLRASGSCAA